MRRIHVLAALIGSLTLPGCGLMRTHYTRPDAPIPDIYEHADLSPKATLDRWWENFNEPNLNAVIGEVLKHNNDLALAVLNVRAAQLQTHLAVINPVVAAGYTYD